MQEIQEVMSAIPEMHGLNILIVDDNATLRLILRNILTARGCRTVEAGTAEEGIAAVRKAAAIGAPYDLVLMDWRMPGMDGIEAAQTLRDDPESMPVPVIVMVSAFGREEVVKQAERAGIEAFLAKPVDPAVLLDTIAAIRSPEGRRRLDDFDAETPPADSPSALSNVRILLAEDNEINRQIAMEQLTEMGVIVEIAENGRIAVEKVEADPERYHAVLMDVQMPEMDGIEATRRIRVNLDRGQLPIIAMTAHAMEEERRRCLAAGMNDHISKPVDPLALQATLARWTAKRVRRDIPAAIDQPDLAGSSAPAALPPFDLAGALIRTNQNWPLLASLIGRFHEQYADFMPKLRESLRPGGYEDAEKLVHGLSGVSSTLGAADVGRAAQSLERALHDHRGDSVPELTERLEDALALALATAKSVQDGLGPEPGPAEISSPSAFEPCPDPELVAELQELLSKNSMKARSRFTEIKAGLGENPSGRHAALMTKQLASLDFRGAELTLAEWAGGSMGQEKSANG